MHFSSYFVPTPKGIIKDVDQNSTEHETRQLLQDVREYPALRKCKEDLFLKKYFKFLWVVFVLLVYLPVITIGALIICHKDKCLYGSVAKNLAILQNQ